MKEVQNWTEIVMIMALADTFVNLQIWFDLKTFSHWLHLWEWPLLAAETKNDSTSRSINNFFNFSTVSSQFTRCEICHWHNFLILVFKTHQTTDKLTPDTDTILTHQTSTHKLTPDRPKCCCFYWTLTQTEFAHLTFYCSTWCFFYFEWVKHVLLFWRLLWFWVQVCLFPLPPTCHAPSASHGQSAGKG